MIISESSFILDIFTLFLKFHEKLCKTTKPELRAKFRLCKGLLDILSVQYEMIFYRCPYALLD